MCEIWKEITGYENIYEVSDKGRVRTSEGKQTHSSKHGIRTWKSRVLKQKTDKGGYKRVTLWKNKVGKDFLVHRLAAMVFIPKIDGKDFVNHKDGNPSNNYINNLEWVTSRENLIHAFENRLNENPDPIVLYNNNTKELRYFYSKSKASEFLGRNNGFVSGILNKGERFVDEYEIFTNK